MPQVTDIVRRLIPPIKCESCLDIGIGDGETIRSIVSHFMVMDLFGTDPSTTIEAPNVEVKKYDESRFYTEKFDLITLFDSLPCYYKIDGEKILDHIIENANKLVIAWLPDGYYPYEPFKSCWHAEDFLKRGFCVYRATNIHQGPPTIGSGLLCYLIK